MDVLITTFPNSQTRQYRGPGQAKNNEYPHAGRSDIDVVLLLESVPR